MQLNSILSLYYMFPALRASRSATQRSASSEGKGGGAGGKTNVKNDTQTLERNDTYTS